jgi:hypothetical protein
MRPKERRRIAAVSLSAEHRRVSGAETAACNERRGGKAMDRGARQQALDLSASTEAVEAELERLLAEERLKLSERNRRFLAFVVREALAGRGNRIKAYTIGVDVFGRGANFDPSNDPIVRIEATRIRSALTTYYGKVHGVSPIRIVIPPGSYVPVFEGLEEEGPGLRDESPINPPPAALPAIIVTVRSVIPDRLSDIFVEFLAQSIAARLRTLRVQIFLTPPGEPRSANPTIERLLTPPASAYALDVSLYETKDEHRQAWSLTDLRTGEVLDSRLDGGAGSSEPSFAVVEEIAGKALTMIQRALALKA